MRESLSAHLWWTLILLAKFQQTTVGRLCSLSLVGTIWLGVKTEECDLVFHVLVFDHLD